MAVTFDTLKFVSTLESAGMPVAQAKAISTAVHDAQKPADVATKGDIFKLDAKIDLVRSDLRGDTSLLRWMIGITLAGLGTMIAKLFWS